MRTLFTSKFALKDPDDSGDGWTRNELQDFLSDIVYSDETYSFYILVDALDEGEKQSDVREMINFLVDLSERALEPTSSLQLRVCLSSRHYPHISIKKGLSLVVEEQLEHDRDIEIYVRKKLIGQARLSGSDDSAKEDLVAEVCRKSASIFLWVVLVVPMLDEVQDHPGLVRDMRKRLDEIPKDLNELFAEILKRSDRDIESCIALLQWMLFSMRPLEPDELFLATEHSRFFAYPNWTPLNAMTVPSKDQLSIYITDCSRGLVELTSGQPPVVQFIHETVRDYLSQPNGLASLLPTLQINLCGISHEVLKTSCIRYIATCVVPDKFERYQTEGYKDKSGLEGVKKNIRAEFPFIEYAVRHAFGHAEQAQMHGLSQADFLSHRMTPNGEWQGYEISWLNVFERFKVRKYTSKTKLLYFVAEQGLTSLVKQLLKMSDSTNCADITNANCGRYGSALQAACAIGNEEIVGSLIANGANVNLVCGEHRHALLTAMYTKNFPVISILQRHGARLNQELLRKALFEMVVRGSVQGVSHLLELGANIDWVNSRKESPLRLAIERQRREVVDLLLLRGADFKTQLGLENTKDWTKMLVKASSNGIEQIVRLLITHGVDVNANNGYALRKASGGGHAGVVRLLIENGADVNADSGVKDGLEGSALYEASQYGHEKVVQLLIENGADVNAIGSYKANALQVACQNGNAPTVRLLIDHKACVNAPGGFHIGNALQAACYGGKASVVQFLIASGAYINAPGGRYKHGNALCTASYRGRTGIVKLLLENGAAIDLPCEKYGSALGAASSRTMTEVVQLLVENGADVNMRGGKTDETPIERAYRLIAQRPCKEGDYLKIIKLLRDAGAEEPQRMT